MARAVSGAEKLLMISSNEIGPRRVAQHRTIINAAKTASVKCLAYTSIMHADTNPVPLAVLHRETEALIRASGIPFVLLRNGWYFGELHDQCDCRSYSREASWEWREEGASPLLCALILPRLQRRSWQRTASRAARPTSLQAMPIRSLNWQPRSAGNRATRWLGVVAERTGRPSYHPTRYPPENLRLRLPQPGAVIARA